MTQKKILQVKNLRIYFETAGGRLEAVNDLHFDLNQGEILAIVGESGCGKSVTSKAIMGLIQPPGQVDPNSTILFEDRNLETFTRKEWESFRGDKAALIFQDALAALNPTMTIGKQVSEGLIYHRKMSKSQASREALQMLERVGLSNPEQRMKQYPHELSGGMRQRVMIATALICHPDLLIADECTTALDVTIQAQIMELLKKIQREDHTSMILITHDLGLVAGIADRIVVMYAGHKVEEGTLREIFYEPAHPYTRGLLQSVPRMDMDEGVPLESIPGNPPELYEQKEGCPFADRCRVRMEQCNSRTPEEIGLSQSHYVSCFQVVQETEKGEK